MKNIKQNNLATKEDIKRLEKRMSLLEQELSSTRFSLGTEIDKSKMEILDLIKEFRQEILGKVAEFAFRTKDTDEEVKILSYRLYEDHEPRIEKLEKKVFLKKN